MTQVQSRYSASFTETFSSLWRNRQLIARMVTRDISGRYRGSIMGLFWSFFNPLLMLAIYTFVFSVIFGARWGDSGVDGRTDFALLLFVGMIMHGLFSECLNRAPGLILANVNYVKKVIFPLEILPWITLGSALFHAGISLIVLLIAQLILKHSLPWTLVLFPLVMLPLALASMGFAWFVSALGVYVRDIGQVTGIFTTALLFLSGVFYPISSLPPRYQTWMRLNPLAYLIEESRNVLILGQPPNFGRLLICTAIALCVAWIGFVWFQRTRKGFSDVV